MHVHVKSADQDYGFLKAGAKYVHHGKFIAVAATSSPKSNS